jgi:hypothetical protein
MNHLLTTEQIKNNPEIYIKWMCYDIYITVDFQVFNLSFKKLKEQLIGGSYCFYCNGKYRTKRWINKNSVNVLNLVTR